MERTKKLQDIQTAMQRDQGIDAYLAVLPSLLDVAEASIEDLRGDAEGLNQISGYMAEIRHLLAEIDRYVGSRIDTLAVLRISDRYRDLEGKFKEMRNDRVFARDAGK
jgi:hypothetical protein